MMGIFFIIVAVLLGYSTSKYFPESVPLISKTTRFQLTRKWTSIIFYIMALVIFIIEFGSGTGTLVWLFTITLIQSLLILALPYKSKLIYVFGMVAIIVFIFDIIHYAS